MDPNKFKKENDILKKEKKILKNETENSEEKIERRERQERRNNIVIQGIKINTKDENELKLRDRRFYGGNFKGKKQSENSKQNK